MQSRPQRLSSSLRHQKNRYNHYLPFLLYILSFIMYNRLVDLIQYEAMVREKNDARKTANIRVAKFDRELSGSRTGPSSSPRFSFSAHRYRRSVGLRSRASDSAPTAGGWDTWRPPANKTDRRADGAEVSIPRRNTAPHVATAGAALQTKPATTRLSARTAARSTSRTTLSVPLVVNTPVQHQESAH
jgi:hypothetical protein